MKSNPPPCQQPKRAVGGEAPSAISMVKIIIDVSEKREEHRLKEKRAVNTTAPSLERAARPTWRSMAQTTSRRWAKKAAKPPGSGRARSSTAASVKWEELLKDKKARNDSAKWILFQFGATDWGSKQRCNPSTYISLVTKHMQSRQIEEDASCSKRLYVQVLPSL